MSKYILILFLLAFPFILLSQEDSTEIIEATDVKIAKHEIGLNFTSLIEQVFSLNDVITEDLNGYLLTYNYLINHKRAIRFGLNVSYDKTNADFAGFGQTPEEFLTYNFNLRVGLVINRRLTNRWSAYLAIDGIYGLSRVESIGANDFLITTNTLDTSTLGIGPAIGVQFFINSKISISTELTLYYKNSQIQNKIEFDDNNFADVVNTSKSFEATLATPASLYFNFRF